MLERCELFNRIFILIIPMLLGLTTEVYSGFEFTNMKCVAVDQQFCEFNYCFLKSVNRTYKYASAKLTVHQRPINNVSVQLVLMKRLNGYKPFLYNFTVDFCKFMRNPNPGNKVENFFYGLVKPFTNANHTCPYTEREIIVEKLPIGFLNHKFTQILPFPEGDYRITCNFRMYGVHRADVTMYFKIF